MNRREFAWTVVGGAILPALAGHVAARESNAQQRTSPPSPSAARAEIAHPATRHEVHLSPPALATDREGPLVAWMTQEGPDNNIVYVARPGASRVRVNPDALGGDSLHQAPGLAVGPRGEIYVTWASRRPKPVGGLFASDLQISRSLDGGKMFEPPLRVNEEAPTSHSFEDVTVTPDGTVIVAWIEMPQGERPHTYLARVVDRGSRVEAVVKLDDDETCVCCRIALASGRPDALAILWR